MHKSRLHVYIEKKERKRERERERLREREKERKRKRERERERDWERIDKQINPKVMNLLLRKVNVETFLF